VLALPLVAVVTTPVVVGMLSVTVLCVEDVPSDVVLEPGLELELEPWLEVELPVVVGT